MRIGLSHPFVLAVLCGASPAVAQERSAAPPPPTVSVVGVAEEEVRPDIAVLTLEVTDDKPTAVDAGNENARLSSAVIDGLKGSGVDVKDIATVGMRLVPIVSEEHDPKNNQVVKSVVTGFRASNILRIRVHVVDRTGALIGASVQNGALYQGVAFDLSDREAHEDALRTKAAANARHRAELYAEGVGAKLGPIQSISAGVSPNPFRSMATMVKIAGPAGSAAPLPVEPGEITLSETVSATWELAAP